MFYPKTVAVIGASNTPNKVGFMCIQSLVKSGYKGKIYPVNHSLHDHDLLGFNVYPSVTAIPEEVDLAIVVIPARLTLPVIEECVAKGVKAAVLITSGFKEVGTESGLDLQTRLADIANKGGMKIVGPNSLGILNPAIHLNATFALSLKEIRAGSVAIAAQSGGMSSYIVDALDQEGVGVSKLIALGNRCNLDFDDMITYFAHDELTRLIVTYVEGMDKPREILNAARQAVQRKPVIVYKGGRGQHMDRAAFSHTGALAGKLQFYKAAFEQTGILTVDSIAELADMAKALVSQPPAPGNSVGIVSVQAGPGIVMADKCHELGLKLAEFSPTTRRKLRQLVSPLNSVDNPVDSAWEFFNYERSVGIVDTVLQDDGVDVLIIGALEYPPSLTKAVVGVCKNYTKPVVACMSWLGQTSERGREQKKMLEKSRIPIFPLPEKAVTGLAGLVRYGELLRAMNHGDGNGTTPY